LSEETGLVVVHHGMSGNAVGTDDAVAYRTQYESLGNGFDLPGDISPTNDEMARLFR